MDTYNIHETYALVDVLEDHHYACIYDYFHAQYGMDKDIERCLILAIEIINNHNQNQINQNQNKKIHCQFENNLFTVDL